MVKNNKVELTVDQIEKLKKEAQDIVGKGYKVEGIYVEDDLYEKTIETIDNHKERLEKIKEYYKELVKTRDFFEREVERLEELIGEFEYKN